MRQLPVYVVSGTHCARARRATAPRLTRGKMPLRREPDDGRSGLGHPDAGANQLGQGNPRGGDESAPPRVGALRAFFELTVHAGRIAPWPDVLRRNPLNRDLPVSSSPFRKCFR